MLPLSTFQTKAAPNLYWLIAASLAPEGRFENVPSGARVPLLLVLPLTEPLLDRAAVAEIEACASKGQDLPITEADLIQKVPESWGGDQAHELLRFRPRGIDIFECLESAKEITNDLREGLLSDNEDRYRRTIGKIRAIHSWFLLLPQAIRILNWRYGLPDGPEDVESAIKLLTGPLARELSPRSGGRPTKTMASPRVLAALYEELILRPSPHTTGEKSRQIKAAMKATTLLAEGTEASKDEERRKSIYDEIRMGNTRLAEKGIRQIAVPFVDEPIMSDEDSSIVKDLRVQAEAGDGDTGFFIRHQAFSSALERWACQPETYRRMIAICGGDATALRKLPYGYTNFPWELGDITPEGVRRRSES